MIITDILNIFLDIILVYKYFKNIF
jgi:hypothetical protein